MTFNREQLIEDYASLIVEGMDMDTLVSFAYDTLVSNLESYDDAELIKEVTEYNPELLEDVTVD
jgi:hypothetical protein